MRLPWRTRRQESAVLDVVHESPPPQAETQPSPGLEAALAGVPSDGSCGVLDLGPAVAGNLDFVSTFASRVQIVDLLGGGSGNPAAPAHDLERGMQAIRELVPLANGTFDLVLAWDLLAYLPSHRIGDLIGALAELCRPEARLHAIVPTTEMIPAVPNRYRIVDAESLVYEPATTDLRGAPELPPNAVDRLLEGFEIEHSFVLRHGVREYVATRDVER
jgi:hypothetical protein